MKAFLVLSDSGPLIVEADSFSRYYHVLLFLHDNNVVERVEGASFWQQFETREEAEAMLAELRAAQ